MKRWHKIILSIVIALMVLLIGSIGYLKFSAYPPSQEAEAASQMSQQNSEYLLFEAPKESDLNLIFYPGALVEPASYSIWASQVAEAGVDVYIVKMPLNMAFFGANRAAKIVAEAPEETYLLGGHSLGGVVASRFAASQDGIAGMIYLASYPDEKGDLAQTELPVLSLSASQDGLVEAKDLADTKQYLPKDATFEVIEGGNHAGFGSYGVQKKDGEATISNEDQQKEISKRMVAWLQTENFLP